MTTKNNPSADQPAPFWTAASQHDGTEDQETLIVDAYGDKELGWWNNGEWHTNAKDSCIDLSQIVAFSIVPACDLATQLCSI